MDSRLDIRDLAESLSKQLSATHLVLRQFNEAFLRELGPIERCQPEKYSPRTVRAFKNHLRNLEQDFLDLKRDLDLILMMFNTENQPI